MKKNKLVFMFLMVVFMMIVVVCGNVGESEKLNGDFVKGEGKVLGFLIIFGLLVM